jgi:hypothetical protein
MGLATVRIPRCVVIWRVCFAASRLILQFAASQSAVISPRLLKVVVDPILTFLFNMGAKRFSFNAGSISIKTEAHWLIKSGEANEALELKSEMKWLAWSPGSMALPNESIVDASWCSNASV